MELRPIFSALLRNKTAPLLVAIQVAISLAILANALFIVQMRIAASARPSGIAEEQNVGYLRVNPLEKLTHNENMEQQNRELAALKAIPGVVSVAWTQQMPMSRSGSSGSVRSKETQTIPTTEASFYYGQESLVPTLGLKIVEGRNFNADDVVEMDDTKDTWHDKFPKGVIVSKALAEVLFPGETQFVGRTFWFGMGADSDQTRIIGVVERMQSNRAQSAPAGEHSAIIPFRPSMTYSRWALRAEPGQLDRVMLTAEETLRKASARPVRVQVRKVSEDRINRYRNEKALAGMLIAVSALLLLVTVSGIVGMTSLRVTQRRKQIGVRRALGARWIDIVRYFVTENILITTGGIVAGLFLAMALNQLLISQLEMGKLPIGYLAFGAGALWLIGIASVWGPASRAANTPPAIATRTA